MVAAVDTAKPTPLGSATSGVIVMVPSTTIGNFWRSAALMRDELAAAFALAINRLLFSFSTCPFAPNSVVLHRMSSRSVTRLPDDISPVPMWIGPKNSPNSSTDHLEFQDNLLNSLSVL